MTNGGAPVWMSIDAKFPKEQYERLVETAEMRSRQMARKVKSVEALPSEAAQLLLEPEDADEPKKGSQN